MSFRDIKRKMRRDVHNTMKLPAIYIEPKTGNTGLLHVRTHYGFIANAIEGAVRAGSGSMIDRRDEDARLIFMLDEIAESGLRLAKNGIVSVYRGEAYRLEYSDPTDDITVKWFVTRITDTSELEDLPIPTEDGLDG